MNQFEEIIDFAAKFGLFKFTVLNIGYAIYWLLILIEERSDRFKKDRAFSIGYFIQKYWLNAMLSTILVWFCAPLLIVEYNIKSNFAMLATGATGGVAIQKPLQIGFNFFKKK